MIEKCRFGSMIVDRQQYRSDVMIFPDGRVVGNWRRAAGHYLEMQDIDDLLAAKPEVLVVGTGIFGLMRPADNLAEMLSAQGIELLAARTKTAAQEYNRLKQGSKCVAACFHLTC